MAQLVCILDYEKHAKQLLPPSAHEYYRGGADEEQTLTDNRQAFKKYSLINCRKINGISDSYYCRRWRLMPRMMRGVDHRDLSTTVLGCNITAPVGIAPTAMQRMAHLEGECATARG